MSGIRRKGTVGTCNVSHRLYTWEIGGERVANHQTDSFNPDP